MKRLLILSILLNMTVAAALSAQPAGIVKTYPRAPSRETLDRLGLALAWHSRIKLPGTPDSLRSVQLLPLDADLQIAVQSLSGEVYLLDAQNGDLVWQTPVGSPYWASQPVAANSQNLFVTRKDLLFVLDRRNGRQRVYTVDRRLNRVDFGYRLPSAPSAAPAASEKFLYVPLVDQVEGLELPLFEAAEIFAKEEYGGLFKTSSLRPEPVFARRYSDVFFNQQPLISEAVVAFVEGSGMYGLNRFGGDFLYRFVATGEVLAPAGQHERMAYIPSTDATLYAVDFGPGRLRWRYLSPGPIMKQPAVTDNHVFVLTERKGMAMLDRGTGQEVWRNRDADAFLAMSDRFVYAADRNGKLLILDIRRGTAQGQLDLGEWRVRIANEYTDRIYLANHDGQLLCLHPRGSAVPLNVKTRSAEVEEPKDPKTKEMDMEKKEDADDLDDFMSRATTPCPLRVRHASCLSARRELQRARSGRRPFLVSLAPCPANLTNV